jgi:hypothetical protein
MRTIATFSKPEEAHLLRMRLENAGISAFLRDENITQIWGGYSVGVHVDVAEEDWDAAQVVLGEEPKDEA